MKFISNGSGYLFFSCCCSLINQRNHVKLWSKQILFCHGVVLLCLKIWRCKGRVVVGKKRNGKKYSSYFLVMLERTKITFLECIHYNTELWSPFVPDHPATTTTGCLIFTQPEIFSFSEDFWDGEELEQNGSISLTCARLDANRVDRGSKLQTGHQLIGLFGLLGLALMVAAVDATTSRVTPQVGPPWSRGTVTCGSTTTTSHSTCLRYSKNKRRFCSGPCRGVGHQYNVSSRY